MYANRHPGAMTHSPSVHGDDSSGTVHRDGIYFECPTAHTDHQLAQLQSARDRQVQMGILVIGECVLKDEIHPDVLVETMTDCCRFGMVYFLICYLTVTEPRGGLVRAV